MRIGLLTTSFPRYEGDIAGNFVLGFARAIAHEGHDVEVLAPEPGEALKLPTFAPVRLSWVSYLRPRALERTFYGAGVLDNLRRDPLSPLGLLPFSLNLARAAYTRVDDWDALVSHWALPCALIAGRIRGHRPHLAVLHSADVSLLERLPARAVLARRITKGAHALLFSSRNLRSRFLALLGPMERSEYASRMHVCAMGVAPVASSPTRHEREALRKTLGLTGFSLLSIGRLVPIKGLAHAIEALAGLPGVELVIAGDGPEREALAALARGLSARVRFVGEVRGEAKSEWLAAADAFVVPSLKLPSGRTEGMPTSVLEAMQAGLPVIGSHVGGLPDVIEPGANGLLVPPGDRAALRAAVTELQRAPESELQRMRRGARESAREYEWPVLGPLFAKLITEADLE